MLLLDKSECASPIMWSLEIACESKMHILIQLSKLPRSLFASRDHCPFCVNHFAAFSVFFHSQCNGVISGLRLNQYRSGKMGVTNPSFGNTVIPVGQQNNFFIFSASSVLFAAPPSDRGTVRLNWPQIAFRRFRYRGSSCTLGFR